MPPAVWASSTNCVSSQEGQEGEDESETLDRVLGRAYLGRGHHSRHNIDDHTFHQEAQVHRLLSRVISTSLDNLLN